MIENKKVITYSLIVLFFSLSMVYSLTYMKKATLFKNIQKRGNEIVTQTENESQQSTTQSTDTSNISNIGNVSKTNNSNSASLGGSTKSSGANDSNTQITKTSNTKKLPGTTEYYGTLDIVSILGQKPKYTLQDSKGNYFAYYENRIDFTKTIQTLGGNVYEMVTESEILQNQLFGDKVSYINLSMFKDVRVIMVVEIDGEIRLLQIPADKYHYSKDYLRSLFVQ